jgi:basic membrane protein A
MLSLCVVLLLAIGLVLTGCSRSSQKPASTGGKIAYVTGTGNLGDKSFNDLGYQGIKRLMEAGIACDVAEPKAIAEMEGILRNFSESGSYALIVGMGGDMVDAMTKVAADYPDQKYMVLDGLAGNKANIRALTISQQDTAFLLGACAGLMEKEGTLKNSQGKNVIGVVGGMDIPLVREVQTAYECGARYVNPDVTVLKAFVGGWADPGTGSELTQGMYERGASIVFQAAGGSGMGVLEAAKKQNLYAIGYDGNQNSIAPDNIIGSGVRGLDAEIESTALEAREGTFQGGDVTIAMKDSPSAAQIAFSETNVPIPDTVLSKLEKIKKFLIEAKVEIPSEPEDVDAYLSRVGVFEQ